MTPAVITKSYAPPPVSVKEVLRYAGMPQGDDMTAQLLSQVMDEAEQHLTYQVCYSLLPVTVKGDVCDLGVFSLTSHSLALNLSGCSYAAVFAATLGVGMDRLIARYGRLAPAKGLLAQSLGAERIEALCDIFCEELAAQTGLIPRPRFSPGYGDCPLGAQREIFTLLNCPKHIGLTLTDSLLMSPTKSVTAFVGLSREQPVLSHECEYCNQSNCLYRGV